MRGMTAVAATGLFCASLAAQACDDHHGVCEIEDWRWYSTADYLTVEGVATCDAGRVRIRLYEGEGDQPRFLGIAAGPHQWSHVRGDWAEHSAASVGVDQVQHRATVSHRGGAIPY